MLKGSEVNPKHLSAKIEKKRAQQMEDYTMLQAGKRIVKKDVVFESPSGAAVFCVGGSANGWDTWKDEEGRELEPCGRTYSELERDGRVLLGDV